MNVSRLAAAMGALPESSPPANGDNMLDKAMNKLRLMAGWVPALVCLALVVNTRLDAATHTVTNAGNSGAGTLRDAIILAAANDTITFNPAVTAITLTTGELLLNKNLTITNPASATVILNGNNATRVFRITNATVTLAGLTITGASTIAYAAFPNGAAIHNAGTLTLISNNFSFNTTRDDGGAIYNAGILTMRGCGSVSNRALAGIGGALANQTNATVWMTDCAFLGNQTDRQSGGAIANGGGMTIYNSTIANNLVADSRSGSLIGGGGIFNNGSLVVSNCSIASNRADKEGRGGGILNLNSNLTVLNSTISGNTAHGLGGGVFNRASGGAATASLTNCTISGNHAGADVAQTRTAGGVANMGTSGDARVNLINCTVAFNVNDAASGTLLASGLHTVRFGTNSATITLRSSIVTSNSAPAYPGSVPQTFADSGGLLTTLGFNLCNDAGINFTNATDLTNANAGIGPLASNGGFTLTHGFTSTNSPAIDQGSRVGSLAADQRGTNIFNFPSVANAAAGDGSDIGAFEMGGTEIGSDDPGPTLIVTSGNDVDDGVCNTIHCSLREAINAAKTSPGLPTITFASGVTSVTLAGGELVIDQNLIITNNTGGVLTIDGDHGSRVFRVTNATVTLAGLTIANGDTTFFTFGDGAAIHNCGTLTIISNAFQFNMAGGGGGAVYNAGVLSITGGSFVVNTALADVGGAVVNAVGATLQLADSDFDGNLSDKGSGGAIANAGTMTMWRCSIHGNSADVEDSLLGGGGLFNTGVLTVDTCNVTDNISKNSGSGGGIFNLGGQLTVLNSTISQNTSDGFGGGIYNRSSGSAATISLTNSTVSRNIVRGSQVRTAAGIANTASAGNATVNLAYSTVAFNSHSTGPGFRLASGLHALSFDASRATFNLRGSLIASNMAPTQTGTVPQALADIGGVLNSLGFNLSSDGSGNLTNSTDRPNANAALGPLVHNGGPSNIFTHALMATSAAMDAANDPQCPATDQRGQHRPSGPACDIGAFELQQVPAITGFTPAAGPTGTVVRISGQFLSNATEVAFGGMSATFTPGSASSITATVPVGAMSGPISVTTAEGTNTSSTSFIVDNSPPLLAITNLVNNSVITNLPAIMGTAADLESGLRPVVVRIQRVSPSGFWNGSTFNALTNNLAVTLTGINWSNAFTPPSVAQLANGTFLVSVLTTNNAGLSNSATVTLVFDKTPPLAAVTNPSNGVLVTNLASVSGTASDVGSGLVSVKLRLQRGNDSMFWNGMAWGMADAPLDVVTNAGNWSRTTGMPSGMDLLDGTYRLSVTALDNAGFSTNSATNSITVDATPPAVAITNPPNNLVATNLPSVAGTASDSGSGLASVALRLQRASDSMFWTGTDWGVDTALAVTTNLDTSWVPSAALPADANLIDDTYTISVVATDNAGLFSTASRTVLVDTTPPLVAITNPPDASTITNLPAIEGTASDGGSGLLPLALRIQRASDMMFWTGTAWGADTALAVTTNADTSWSVTTGLPAGMDLANGVYTLTVSATNHAGLSNSASVSVTVAVMSATIVTTNADAGPGSLRQVIADSDPDATITFDASLSGATILLTSGRLLLDKNLTIDASALSGGITISGNGDQILRVNSGRTVSLLGLTLTGGDDGNGSAIYNDGGLLTLTHCTLSGNMAGVGGAIYNDGGTLTLTHCTLSGNMAGFGGAIYNDGGTLTLTHCTLSGNSANDGGAIFHAAGILTLNNSIVAGNSLTGGGSGADIFTFAGTVNREGANIVQDFVNVGGTDTGPAAIADPPLLAPLGNYGGPTQTMPPLPGSPAIDGADATAFTTDQRGFPRSIGLGPDIGAVEGVFNPDGASALTGLLSLMDGSFLLGFTNYSGMTQTVLGSTNVAAPLNEWLNLGPAVETPPDSGQFQFTDPQATNRLQRFYRVRTP